MTHLAATAPLPAEPPASATTPGLLRFITCGSVDDGKSTLIGRLLADTGNIADDQIATLAADSRRFGTREGRIDYALLLDGLSAEREQGITIDVAHRYFATPRRNFIVADTPGHRQYTRNMATGASLADLAVVLVDARQGVLEQTRRHTLIVALLGVAEVVLAINKMDLVGYDRVAFDAIVAEYARFAATLPGLRVTPIPLCARESENVVAPSAHMPWYAGPTLLEHLETVAVPPAGTLAALRFPVQLALRPDATFRGYAGTIAAGRAAVGDAVAVLPSGKTSRIARIATADGDRSEAEAGRAVTLVLADALDVSRGDTIVAAGARPVVADRIEALLLWAAETPLDPSREYLVKLGTATVAARLDPPVRGLDVATGAVVPIAGLELNGIAEATVRLLRPLPVDTYAQNRATGGFVVIDPVSHETVAMGLVRAGARAWRPPTLPRARERRWRSLTKAVSWRATGTALTILFAWFFSGSVGVALSVGAGEVLTKIGLYYLHERGWARIPYGLDRGE